MEQQQRNPRAVAQESEEMEEIQHGPSPDEQLQIDSAVSAPAPLTQMEKAFKVLVELLGRAFYEDLDCDGRVSNTNDGFLIVLLDHLGRNPRWLTEEEISKQLKLSQSRVHRGLYFLQQEKLVRGDMGCRLNYDQLCDVIAFKLLMMRKTIQKKQENPEYSCPKCDKNYNSFDAVRLISENGEMFVCECGEEVISEMDRGREHELEGKLEVQLKPLQDQRLEISRLQKRRVRQKWVWGSRSSLARSRLLL